MRRTRISWNKKVRRPPRMYMRSFFPALFADIPAASRLSLIHRPQSTTHDPRAHHPSTNDSLQLFSDEATNIDLRSL